MILFMVEQGNGHVLTTAAGGDPREQAKRQAFKWLGGDPDRYVVTPLTAPGDRIHLDITVYI